MKIWTSQHTFDHPWETVVQAAWRKYPNPLNKSVEGIDVVERRVERGGVLHSERLMQTRWPVPSWITRMIGMHETAYVKEISKVDQKNKHMHLTSANLTLTGLLDVDEKLVYTPHPDNPNHTLLRQETVILIHGMPLGDFLENKVINTCEANAQKGRQAMEWVIGRIKEETSELSRAARAGMDRAAAAVDRQVTQAQEQVTQVEDQVAQSLPGSATSR